MAESNDAMAEKEPLFSAELRDLGLQSDCDRSGSLDTNPDEQTQSQLEDDLNEILMAENNEVQSLPTGESLFDFGVENSPRTSDSEETKFGEEHEQQQQQQSEPPMNAEFDLDALFFDSEGIQEPAEPSLEEQEQELLQKNKDAVNEEDSSSPAQFHLPQLSSSKRSLTPPNDSEDEVPDAKRSKANNMAMLETSTSDFHFPEAQCDTPQLLLPEHVIPGPVETLTPESSAVPSPTFSSRSDGSPVPDTVCCSLVANSIKQMKERMISAHTLLTTYTALKKTSAQVSTQLKTANIQLGEANKWRFILADENARLRSRVSIVTKEKEHLKIAITKLHSDTNGLKKNEILHNEINEKNIEIARL